MTRAYTKQIGKTCKGPGCDLPARASGMCMGHYHQKRRGHKRLRPIKRDRGTTEPQTYQVRSRDGGTIRGLDRGKIGVTNNE